MMPFQKTGVIEEVITVDTVDVKDTKGMKMTDTIKMSDGLVCEVQGPKPGLATCGCGSGIVPESVYVVNAFGRSKRLTGFHCRKCVRNFARR